MSWEDESIPILRVLIGDDEGPYSYCDTRLINVLASVAKLLVFELSFSITYTVTVSTSTISPDPVNDQFFISLLVLKSAVIIAASEYKAVCNSGGFIVDGPSTINLQGVPDAYKKRLDALQKNYDQAKLQYAIGNGIGCQFVMNRCETIFSNCYRDKQFCYDSYRNRC